VVVGEIEKHGFAGRFDRIAFFGFSQGTIMALDAVATGRWQVRAVVAASGRLTTAPEAKTEHFTNILVMHGENDPVIPAEETLLAAERLRAAGFEVEAKLYPGLGHVLSTEGVQTAGKFLARQLVHA
jgi:phospholipase/carboxylesterase